LKTIPHPYKNGGDDSKLPTITLSDSGRVTITSDADIDADGSPRAKEIDPGSGQLGTSLCAPTWRGNGQYVNAETIPYFVLPMNFAPTTGIDCKLGDVARISWRGRSIFAILADRGPNDKLGEISIAAAEALGFSPWSQDKKRIVRGIPHGVVYEIIPRSANLSKTTDFESIQLYGNWLFEGAVSRPVVALDSGHSRKSPGARSNSGKVREEILNEAATKLIKKTLEAKGIEAPWFEPDPDNLTQVGRSGWGSPKIMISWHHNSYNNVDGTPGLRNPYVCVMVSKLAPQKTKIFAQKCARAIHSALKGTPQETALFSGNNGLEGVYEASLTVTNESLKDPDGNPPMHVLVEAFFLNPFSNEAECIASTEKAATAVANVVLQELGGTSAPERPTLRKGDTGEEVKELQRLLSSQGFKVGEIDGIFGKDTLTAVLKFQTKFLGAGQADGVVGPKTWAALEGNLPLDDGLPGAVPASGVKVYKKGADVQLSKNFHLSEYACKCSQCSTVVVDHGHVANLQRLRDKLGRPINITSGYRCENHNAAVGGVKNSEHVQGSATDLVVNGMSPAAVANAAENFDGLGRYAGFTHVDSRGYKARWNG
jgi:N-acetylmuramoyl-L-alanine amidase